MINKKAQFVFLPYILIGMVIIIVFAIVAIPLAYVFDETADALKENDLVNQSDVTVLRINQIQSLVTPAFDQIIFFILISVVLASLVIAIFSDFHPVVLGFFIISTLILVIVSGLMANVYSQVSDNAIITDKASEFTFTNIVMGTQFPIIILIVGILAVIIILAKRGNTISPV